MQKPFQTPFNLCNFKRAAQIHLQGRKLVEENGKLSRPGAAWNHMKSCCLHAETCKNIKGWSVDLSKIRSGRLVSRQGQWDILAWHFKTTNARRDWCTCQKTSQIQSVICVSNFAHDTLLASFGYFWMILWIDLLNHAALAISSPLFGAFRMFASCMLGNEWKLL